MSTITREQAVALAEFICLVREDWDKAGLILAIGKVKDRGDVWTLARVAVAAAAEVGNRTPAVVALTGCHWSLPVAGSSRPTTAHPDDLCSTCGRVEGVCRQVWHADHAYMSRGKARAKAIRDAETRRGRKPTLASIEEFGGRPVEDVSLP